MPLSLWITTLLAIAVFLVAPRIEARLRRRRREKELGCLPVKKYPHTHILGYDLYRKRVEAAVGGRRNGFDFELFNRYGATYEERAGFSRIINTIDIDNFQATSITTDFGRGSRRAAFPFFGHGILNMNGSEWKRTRGLVTPLFKRAELMDIESFKKFVDRLFTLIPRDGNTVDMQPLLQKLFLDSSTEFIFGESIDSLRDTTMESQDFLLAFNEALGGAGKRLGMGGVFSFLYMFDEPWKKAYSKVHAFIDERVKHYLEDSSNTAVPDNDRKSRYVLIDGMAKVIKDPIQLRYHLLDIFFPAKDTTAVAVSNALFCLARNPQLWVQLRQEAWKIRDQTLTFDRVRSLHSFRYTILETLRLYGPSGQIRKYALRDTTIPRGGGPDGSAPVFVPKGTGVFLNTFPTNRNKEIWGEDVEVFRPSRFEGKVLKWEFTPFSGGPRICPAVTQVITQSMYLLVRLVLEFEMIENRDPCLEYVEATRMLVESRNGIKVAFHVAQP